eukprot:9630427-Alexandrium_andersonii.AAC.1
MWQNHHRDGACVPKPPAELCDPTGWCLCAPRQQRMQGMCVARVTELYVPVGRFTFLSRQRPTMTTATTTTNVSPSRAPRTALRC